MKGTESNVVTGENLLDIVSRWGFTTGQVVQEIGWDEDVDQDLREAIEEAVDGDLEDEDFGEIADVVLLWFRDDDGDLTDSLVDAVTALDDGGNLWLLTPKNGVSGHVSPSVVQEAASTAGLNATSPVVVGETWSASRIAVRGRGK